MHVAPARHHPQGASRSPPILRCPYLDLPLTCTVYQLLSQCCRHRVFLRGHPGPPAWRPWKYRENERPARGRLAEKVTPPPVLAGGRPPATWEAGRASGSSFHFLLLTSRRLPQCPGTYSLPVEAAQIHSLEDDSLSRKERKPFSLRMMGVLPP